MFIMIGGELVDPEERDWETQVVQTLA